MLVEAGLDRDGIRDGLASGGQVPGRMQVVGRPASGGPLAVVDYAHSADAVAAALRALRRSTQGTLRRRPRRGRRPRPGKREAMGAAAARGADVVVVTDDNPRGEDPGAIRAAVVAGAGAAAEPGVEVLEVADRADAIAVAVERATGGRHGAGGRQGARAGPGGGRHGPPVRRPRGARATHSPPGSG